MWAFFFHKALILCDFFPKIDEFGADIHFLFRFLLWFLGSSVLFRTLRIFLFFYSVLILTFHLFVLILNFVFLISFRFRLFYLPYCGTFILLCCTSFYGLRLLLLVLFYVFNVMLFFNIVLRCVVRYGLLLFGILLEFLHSNGHI